MTPSLPRKNTSHFSMPFGTSIVPGDGVQFRLWAPMAREVELCLNHRQSGGVNILPMERHPDGWFVLEHQESQTGDLYQYQIDGLLRVPDPASRFQAGDVHGESVVCDPLEHNWADQGWKGRAWEETVIYELHIGAFSPLGDFDGVRRRLDYLKQLGITAIELMPVSHFPGGRNWGYDGALLFAPCNRYGTPEDFKNLVQAAHQRGLMIFLDVVYNHFGPEGNYLYTYARDAFFTDEHRTPWGKAIRFSGHQSRVVRKFFISNALYWLEEYHLDGLRIDAVHAIFDPSEPDIIEEIAHVVQQGPGSKRDIHLILENDNNRAQYLERKRNDSRPRFCTAQWNDDIHHSLHVLLTHETEGYYIDYIDAPIKHLARCLTQGFAYQGEMSSFRKGQARGDPSSHLPAQAFVSFLQNHDQIGNRAFGERLSSICNTDELSICTALLLLSPQIPLFFMGEEFKVGTPFYYFCEFGPSLAESVTAGRREEFASFQQFSSVESQKSIPDPNAEMTFIASKLDWDSLVKNGHWQYFNLYKELLKIRHREIIPRLKSMTINRSGAQILGEKALQVWWKLGDGSILSVQLNLARRAVKNRFARFPTRVLFTFFGNGCSSFITGYLPPRAIIWTLHNKGGQDD